MNSNVKKCQPIPIGCIEDPPKPNQSMVIKDPLQINGRRPASNVVLISSRKMPSVKVRRSNAPSLQIERDEIQEAMDCLLRLKAIIALRESDLVAH